MEEISKERREQEHRDTEGNQVDVRMCFGRRERKERESFRVPKRKQHKIMYCIVPIIHYKLELVQYLRTHFVWDKLIQTYKFFT